MSELTLALRTRTLDALASLELARATDDELLEHVRLGELDSLARTAAEHDLDLPELAPYRVCLAF